MLTSEKIADELLKAGSRILDRHGLRGQQRLIVLIQAFAIAARRLEEKSRASRETRAESDDHAVTDNATR
jgi:hypothetical protein